MVGRLHYRLFVALATLTASLLVTMDSISANPPQTLGDELVFESVRRASDEGLPPQARKGSGLLGILTPNAFEATTLSFKLPDGRVLKARRQHRVNDGVRELQSWTGTFEDQPGSLAVLGTYRGTTTGFIAYGAELWEIVPSIDKQLMLYRFDDRDPPAVTEPRPKTPTATTQTPRNEASDPSPEQLARGYVHDLLVLYTPKAAARYGPATLESMIAMAVEAANQAYRNSGVVITLNLVGLEQVEYSEKADMAGTLSDLKDHNDGHLAHVHAVRDRLGADIVSMIGDFKDSCGLGFTMRKVDATSAATAFNVVSASCLSNQSLAHEVGHNQGNLHDRESTNNRGAFAYSYGYRRCTEDGTGFRDIMAYGCHGGPRIARFSSPALSAYGHPTGIPFEADQWHGADAVRSMNNTAATVADFRQRKDLPRAEAPSKLSAWSANAKAVTLHWHNQSKSETGFKVERSNNGVEFEQIAIQGPGTTTFTDNDVMPAPRYHYRVRAYNGHGNSDYTNVRTVEIW